MANSLDKLEADHREHAQYAIERINLRIGEIDAELQHQQERAPNDNEIQSQASRAIRVLEVAGRYYTPDGVFDEDIRIARMFLNSAMNRLDSSRQLVSDLEAEKVKLTEELVILQAFIDGSAPAE